MSEEKFKEDDTFKVSYKTIKLLSVYFARMKDAKANIQKAERDYNSANKSFHDLLEIGV